MAAEPKRIFVEVVGRLGRETQFHLDERHHHFRITDLVLMGVSALLIIMAVFNVYFIYVLYQDLNGIVNNMDSMHNNLKEVNVNMAVITGKVGDMDEHLAHMDRIDVQTQSLAQSMPRISGAMSELNTEVATINTDVGLMNGAMSNISHRMGEMTGGVSVMRENVRQISRPMGFMNPMMP
ncbi:MAG: translation initiation factor 2 [Candidatus Sedimenticola sp. PURPLELP]